MVYISIANQWLKSTFIEGVVLMPPYFELLRKNCDQDWVENKNLALSRKKHTSNTALEAKTARLGY